MADKPNAQERLVRQVFTQIQKEYAQEQKDEAARLHNKFASIIGELKPNPETLLLVLELIKQEALGNLIQKMEEIKATPQEVKTIPQSEPLKAEPKSAGGVSG